MTASYGEIFFAAVILLLPFLYESSRTFRFYAKHYIYYIIVSFNSIFFIPIFSFRAGNVRNLVLASHVCRFISPLIGLRWILRGKEHLEKERACIIVSNHQSSLDVLGLFEIWPVMDKCTVVAKKELFYAWPFGLAAWLCGLIFIDRMNTSKAKGALNDAIDLVKLNKTKLWVFPEGTRRNTGEIHSFKKGAFHMAISGQIPILPVVYSRYYFLNNKTKQFDHGNVIISVLEPISTEGMTTENVEGLMAEARAAMTEAFKKTSAEAPRICA